MADGAVQLQLLVQLVVAVAAPRLVFGRVGAVGGAVADGADAAVGSRALRRELVGRRQPWFREYGGRFFNLLVRFLTGLSIRDTQCGLKLFRRVSTHRAFELQRATGFGFDPELLFLIRRTGGKMIEVPVRWYNDPASRVQFLRDSTRMVLDLIALRWRAWRGTYGPAPEHGK